MDTLRTHPATLGRLAALLVSFPIVACAAAADESAGRAGHGGHGNADGGGPVAIDCPAGKLDCNGDPADGCEVDAATDPQHCARCERDCRGGACESGVCGAAVLFE